jgi:hypothetical protein
MMDVVSGSWAVPELSPNRTHDGISDAGGNKFAQSIVEIS